MPKFRKKPVVEATQWFKNGDHPGDDCSMVYPHPGSETKFKPFLEEGKVVRYYRTPDLDGQHGHYYLCKPDIFSQIEIEAWQWDGRTLKDAKIFLRNNGLPLDWSMGSRDGITGLIVPTPMADRVARKGDWVIRGMCGEYYICSPDVFEKIYEPVESMGVERK